MPAVTEFPNAERLNELMIVGPITVRSACSHHLCPIFGKVWIGLLPNEHSNLIGLSKYARIADWIMSRPQIQEEAVTMLANELQERVRPDGLAIVMEADHFCMHWRGVKDTDSAMVNSVMRGAFLKDANLRREFLSLLPRKSKTRNHHARPTDVCQPRRRPRWTRTNCCPSCARARPTTRGSGVTGVLCFSEGIFLQVLEGGRSAVNQLYNRIAADTRHTQVELLQLRRDRRTPLRRLEHGPGQHGAAEPGAAAEVFRARHAGPVCRLGRGLDVAVRGTGGHRFGGRPALTRLRAGLPA